METNYIGPDETWNNTYPRWGNRTYPGLWHRLNAATCSCACCEQCMCRCPGRLFVGRSQWATCHFGHAVICSWVVWRHLMMQTRMDDGLLHSFSCVMEIELAMWKRCDSTSVEREGRKWNKWNWFMKYAVPTRAYAHDENIRVYVCAMVRVFFSAPWLDWWIHTFFYDNAIDGISCHRTFEEKRFSSYSRQLGHGSYIGHT